MTKQTWPAPRRLPVSDWCSALVRGRVSWECSHSLSSPAFSEEGTSSSGRASGQHCLLLVKSGRETSLIQGFTRPHQWLLLDCCLGSWRSWTHWDLLCGIPHSCLGQGVTSQWINRGDGLALSYLLPQGSLRAPAIQRQPALLEGLPTAHLQRLLGQDTLPGTPRRLWTLCSYQAMGAVPG